jgi:quinol monooxygenase YgiN
MAIKVIIEMQARPGERDDLKRLLDDIVAAEGRGIREFLGSTLYEVIDDPDLLVEIAEWESIEARMAHLQDAMAAVEPLMQHMAAPFRVMVISPLD